MTEIKKVTVKDSSSVSAVIYYKTLLKNTDRYSFWILTLIEDILLGSSRSPLSLSLMKSDVGGDISSLSEFNSSYQNYIFSFGLDDLKKEYRYPKIILDFFTTSLLKITQENCYKDLQETSLKYYKIMLKEGVTSKPKFLFVTKRLIPSIVNDYDDLFLHIRSIEYLERIEKESKDNPNFFKDFVINNIINNSDKLLIYAEGEFCE